ncbi:MAG: DEAD/DEAH box helicase [Deltaproteobacteria bacterium]|nr:DEAD/DEAH box helicase [Deltaproteobacteria bacterium]
MNQELNVVILPNGSMQQEWSPASGKTNKSTRLLQEEIQQRFLSNVETWLLFLGFCDKRITLSPSMSFWRSFAGSYTLALSRTPDLESIRHLVEIPITEEQISLVLDSAPTMTGVENLHKELLQEVWAGLNRAFSREIASYAGSVKAFINAFSPGLHLVGRIFFHLVENKKSDDPFAFLVTYSTRLDSDGNSKHLPLRYALEEYEDDNAKLLDLLVTVQDAAKQSPLVKELLESGELFHPISWPAAQAFVFLKEVPLYEDAGILCRIPDWWKGKPSRIALNLSLGDSEPAVVGMESLLDFRPQLLIGETEISEKEARQLLNESQGLAYIKNRWVAVDPEKLQQTLEAFERAKAYVDQDGGISLLEAMRFQLSPQKNLRLEQNEIPTTISNGAWLTSIFEKLRHPEKVPKVKTGRTFKTDLRKYQQNGLNWLVFLDRLGFGSCLADDMGLGKTVQLLAFLDTQRVSKKKATSKSRKASLLVIPATLISNWVAEIQRFTPELDVFVAHPEAHPGKKVPALGKTALDPLDLVITTYGLLQKYEWIHAYTWRHVILDEAQAIKNPGTKQTRAVKALTANNRIVMTGTPIENRLADLWSLFDFLNPGLLGSTTEFTRFSKKLKDDPSGYSRLRKLISPFLLRRLKTDKSIISDLPDKVEMKTWAPLSKKQVLLYKQTIDDIQETIENTAGIQRRGLILAALIKFKQLCNHPDQFLGTGNYLEKESGKFGRLREICETIYEKREKVLVFTQFKEMTEPLSKFLETIFEREGLVLHGSVPVGKRKHIIEKFQSKAYIPFMVLSLKAGGIGLNLTEANHVIHFDRWWNPAVENQATDRTFRIGQKKNVVVHKFLTKGTIEEKIDRMLEKKAQLSNEVIAETGENWITEMDNQQLLELFTLKVGS